MKDFIDPEDFAEHYPELLKESMEETSNMVTRKETLKRNKTSKSAAAALDQTLSVEDVRRDMVDIVRNLEDRAVAYTRSSVR